MCLPSGLSLALRVFTKIQAITFPVYPCDRIHGQYTLDGATHSALRDQCGLPEPEEEGRPSKCVSLLDL